MTVQSVVAAWNLHCVSDAAIGPAKLGTSGTPSVRCYLVLEANVADVVVAR